MMRFLPDVFTDTFEDMWKDPFFTKSNSCMKTDVRELDGNYLLDMELPGYKKEDIHLDLKDGYLNIQPQKTVPTKRRMTKETSSVRSATAVPVQEAFMSEMQSVRRISVQASTTAS